MKIIWFLIFYKNNKNIKNKIYFVYILCYSNLFKKYKSFYQILNIEYKNETNGRKILNSLQKLNRMKEENLDKKNGKK